MYPLPDEKWKDILVKKGSEKNDMIKELDSVVLCSDLPDLGLKAGDVGTVVLEHSGAKGFEVEFVALDGETIAVASLAASQIRAIARGEIAHARGVEQGKPAPGQHR